MKKLAAVALVFALSVPVAKADVKDNVVQQANIVAGIVGSVGGLIISAVVAVAAAVSNAANNGSTPGGNSNTIN